MLRRITTINKRGIQRFMHNHSKPVEEKEMFYCHVEWKKTEEKLLAISSQLNKMDKKIVDIEKEVVEHNKKVETIGELAGVGIVSFTAGYWVTHLFFKFLL
jgi:hypothetical protein